MRMPSLISQERGRSTCAPFAVRARSGLGVTLVEASVMLAVVSVLSAILAPSINNYIEEARVARATEDVQTIGQAIKDFIKDTGELQFLKNGSNHATLQGAPPTRDDSNRIALLISDGDIP